MTETELRAFADRIRLRAVRMVAPHGFGYLGQALSSAELVATLYGEAYRPGVDRIVCSPGHYAIVFFGAAVELGLLDEAELECYGFDDSPLEAIGTERSPVFDLVCGTLGTGLSGAVGFALADRLHGECEPRVYALVSDGELEEGQLWEAALFASHQRLSRLVVLLDANDSQVDGPVSTVTTLEPVAAKWQAFGWNVAEVDGHNVAQLGVVLEAVRQSDRPSVIVARTSIRHGLAVLPDDLDGHFVKLPADLAARATRELEARLA